MLDSINSVDYDRTVSLDIPLVGSNLTTIKIRPTWDLNMNCASYVAETDRVFIIKLTVEGLQRGDISVSVENEKYLIVKGVLQRRKGWVKYEFMNKYRLPRYVDMNSIKMDFQDGKVLNIEVAKLPPRRDEDSSSDNVTLMTSLDTQISG